MATSEGKQPVRAMRRLRLALLLLPGGAAVVAAGDAPDARRPAALTVLTYNVRHHTDTLSDDLKALDRYAVLSGIN